MHVFVIAMPKEANAVKHNLSLAFTRTIHGMEVTKGLIKNKEETAVVVSGIGKTNAAAATMLAINLFNPKSIINIGLAGGLDPELQMGYIVKVKKVVQSDFSLNGIDGVPVGVMDGNDTPYIRLDGPFEEKPVVCATNDRFISDGTDSIILRKTFGAQVCDMELGAIAQVCRKADTPISSWKVISDITNDALPPVQYLNNIAHNLYTIQDNVVGIFEEVLQADEMGLFAKKEKPFTETRGDLCHEN